MKEITLADVEAAVKSIADTALRNRPYFSELDSFAGDADFGVSLASGFRAIEQDWNELDRSSIGNFLLKISMIISRNVGGCSGPIWGTGFMRAGALCKERTTITLADLEKMLSASIEGIQKRGGAQVGDKTLLDALIPIRDIVQKRWRPQCRLLAGAAASDPGSQRCDRTHQGLGCETRPAAVHRRSQQGYAGPRDRSHRNDDERSMRAIRCR